MKQTKKVLAVLLAIVMLLSMTSCGSVGKWVARSENTEVPVGAYLMYESMYYQYASYYVEDYTKSPLKQTVELEDKTKMTGAEWIKKNALDVIYNAITVMEECKRLGVTLTQNEQDLIQEEAASTWETNVDSYELIGVGKNSLEYMHRYNKLSEKLFNYYYGEGGPKAVSKDELKKHFEEKYDSVDYFSVSLKDADGKTLPKADQNAIEDELEKLAEQLNAGGVDFDTVVAAYNAEHKDSTVKATNQTGELESVFATELANKLKKCKQGEAIVVEYSSKMFLLYRAKIETKTEEYLKENEDALRHELKDEEYTKYLEKAEESMKIVLNNEAIDKYSPKWIEKRVG